MYFLQEDLYPKSSTLMDITSYPEKFSREITVEISADAEDHCIIVLSHPSGRILRMMGVNLAQGRNNIYVDNVDTLESGDYQLTVKNTESDLLYTSVLTKD